MSVARLVRRGAAIIACACMTATALAQPIVYPAKGQSQAQLNRDSAECHVWAKNTTGIDPAVVARQAGSYSPPPEPEGERAKGALVGAAVGGIIGGIGGHGGEGAAAGAVVGILAGGHRQRQKQSDYNRDQQQAQQYAANQMATFNRAFTVCMEGRGYATR